MLLLQVQETEGDFLKRLLINYWTKNRQAKSTNTAHLCQYSYEDLSLPIQFRVKLQKPDD